MDENRLLGEVVDLCATVTFGKTSRGTYWASAVPHKTRKTLVLSGESPAALIGPLHDLVIENIVEYGDDDPE